MKQRRKEARQQAEDNLRESERKLREAQEMAHLGFWFWDVKTGQVNWSEEVYKIFCLDPNEFTPQIDSILALSPWPEDHQRNQELINRAIESHGPGYYEQKFLRPDQSIGHYYSTFQGNYDEYGDLISIVGTVLDVTERKKAEEVIFNERHMLRTLIDNLPALIYIKDSECRKVIANKADVKNIGFNKEAEILGKTDIELFPGEVGQRGYADDKTVITTGKAIVDREEDFIDRDGVRRWLLTSKIPLYDNDGKISGLVGIGHDITERKKNEAELILAKEKAEESDRLKTAFLNNISHEIRTPLNAIVGFASILGTSELPADKKKEFVDIINVSNDQLLSIISGILSMATLEAGQEKINEEETDINQLLLNVYEQFLVNPISAEVTFSYPSCIAR